MAVSVTAHPRSRGENIPSHRRGRAHWGSSPLTRGKLNCFCACDVCRGLIPAHAGKTQSGPVVMGVCRAHPRSRGENKDALAAVKGTAGSSPLTRGKHVQRDVDFHDPGLIPAHAGKTARPSCASPWTTAHPRSRGENEGHAVALDGVAGSSPLTRGKRGLHRA